MRIKTKQVPRLRLGADNSLERKRGAGWLESANFVAQIALAVVAIFGYFYTVRPIFQKERLAEQVAEYEGIIKEQKPKIAEIERQLSQLQAERDSLNLDVARIRADSQREQARLVAEIKNTERQLAAAREEKARVERLTEYMVYRYRLPDGRPAVTPEQVRVAQVSNLSRAYASSVEVDCVWSSATRPLSRLAGRVDSKVPTFPFTPQELAIWKELGTTYPMKIVTDCINATTAVYMQRNPNFTAELEGLRKDALDFATRQAAAKVWTPPFQPEDLLQELATGRASIQSSLAASLKKNEEEYGDWESAILPDRRSILRYNFQVGKINANTTATSDQLSLEFRIVDKANRLRAAIDEEVQRLTPRTGPPAQK